MKYKSEAEVFLPPALDHKTEYQTFSQKELHGFLSDKAGKDNSFIGTKVKVFARFHKESNSWINRTRLPKWKRETGCQLALCDSLERLTTHKNDLGSLAQGASIDLSNFTTGAYFSNAEKYRVFLAESDKKCSFTYPCYVWILGELGFAKGARKYQGLVNLDLRIAYIDVDDVLMIEGSDNAMVEILKEVVPIASRARAVTAGFRSLFR